jgi:hypothetical protein
VEAVTDLEASSRQVLPLPQFIPGTTVFYWLRHGNLLLNMMVAVGLRETALKYNRPGAFLRRAEAQSCAILSSKCPFYPVSHIMTMKCSMILLSVHVHLHPNGIMYIRVRPHSQASPRRSWRSSRPGEHFG